MVDYQTPVGSCEWSKNIFEIDDLYYFDGKRKIFKKEIEDFIWNMFRTVLGDNAPFKFSYTDNMLNEDKKPYEYPIIIDVQGKKNYKKITDYLRSISSELRSSFSGIVPEDVIWINYRKKIPEIFVKQE